LSHGVDFLDIDESRLAPTMEYTGRRLVKPASHAPPTPGGKKMVPHQGRSDAQVLGGKKMGPGSEGKRYSTRKTSLW
jgi:hypothetical protein